jgi:chemotaxis response regulator CheB
MKSVLSIFLLVFSFSSFTAATAKTTTILNFECNARDNLGVHKFDAKGVLSIDDETHAVEGIITLQTEKSDAPGSILVFEELKVSGKHKHFNAGELTANSFDQFELETSDRYIKSLNLLMDFKVEIASQVYSVDNFLYRSNCTTVK